MASADSPEALHHLIIRHVIETGHAPSLQRLAELSGFTEARAISVLNKLQSIHGVILVPNSSHIWSIHPFALNPTSFWVASAEAARGWWANCAWCALGIGAAIRQDVAITTSDGGEGDPLEFFVAAGRASRADLLMNFPYPPERWWDNPFAPCANILFFSSPARIDSWRSRHGHPQGSVLSIDLAIGLAALWFGDYASPHWLRKTAGRANQIFTELGLDRSFWNLPESFR